MHLLAPFILQNFKTILRADPGCAIFWPQNGPFIRKIIFFVQTITITFIYLLSLFIVQNLKQFLQWIQSYEDASFLRPKWSICPKQKHFW